ncbi:MAG: hypothetical protein ACWGSD_13385 [Thermodesulfobacteriota bacterium]
MRHDMSVADPVVSVIIASYNAVATIGDTLESLEGQTARRQCEVIVGALRSSRDLH